MKPYSKFVYTNQIMIFMKYMLHIVAYMIAAQIEIRDIVSRVLHEHPHDQDKVHHHHHTQEECRPHHN